MEQSPNHELEYAADDYFDVSDSESREVSPRSGGGLVDVDGMEPDLEDELELKKPDADTSALEARNGKDIQGIPWERFNFTREEYRKSRLKQYRNFESLSCSREDLEKKCKEVENGHSFYEFQFNTRVVKSTIVHFQPVCVNQKFILQVSIPFSCSKPNACCRSDFIALLLKYISALEGGLPFYVSSWSNNALFHMLRNLLWATSKHDVFLMQNYSVMHWSSLRRRATEVLNVSKPIKPTSMYPGCLAQTLSRVYITTMAVKDNLMVAGGFQGELICKYLNESGVAFYSKLATDETAITNSVDIYHDPSGSMRVGAANNDAQVRVFDASDFTCLNCFSFPWCVNNTSASPDGKLLAILGDNPDCLIADAQSGKVLSSLKGHLDYSFASAWHPDGQLVATGNQDTTCRLWDIRNLSESLAVLKGRMGAIRSIRFTSDGRFLAMAEPADFVHVFDAQSGYAREQEIDLFGEIAGISFSPDTDALFISVSDRTYGSLMEFKQRKYNHYLNCIL